MSGTFRRQIRLTDRLSTVGSRTLTAWRIRAASSWTCAAGSVLNLMSHGLTKWSVWDPSGLCPSTAFAIRLTDRPAAGISGPAWTSTDRMIRSSDRSMCRTWATTTPPCCRMSPFQRAGDSRSAPTMRTSGSTAGYSHPSDVPHARRSPCPGPRPRPGPCSIRNRWAASGVSVAMPASHDRSRCMR
jgi:hypothetical protein